MNTIFPNSSMNTFNVIANIGLILFMFMVGLELDLKFVKKQFGSAVVISISAMVLPFLMVCNIIFGVVLKTC